MRYGRAWTLISHKKALHAFPGNRKWWRGNLLNFCIITTASGTPTSLQNKKDKTVLETRELRTNLAHFNPLQPWLLLAAIGVGQKMHPILTEIPVHANIGHWWRLSHHLWWVNAINFPSFNHKILPLRCPLLDGSNTAWAVLQDTGFIIRWFSRYYLWFCPFARATQFTNRSISVVDSVHQSS